MKSNLYIFLNRKCHMTYFSLNVSLHKLRKVLLRCAVYRSNESYKHNCEARYIIFSAMFNISYLIFNISNAVKSVNLPKKLQHMTKAEKELFSCGSNKNTAGDFTSFERILKIFCSLFLQRNVLAFGFCGGHIPFLNVFGTAER